MNIKLKFLGATRNVTGSRHLLDVDGKRILIDCGLYQERELRYRNWDPFPVAPESIDTILLTHAHLDHCGFLPKLVRDGFKGKILCTSATVDISKIVLLDSAHLQQEDAELKKKRHKKEGRRGKYPEIPLYTVSDVEKVFPLFTPVFYKQPVKIGKSIEVTFYDAGHILGSAMIKIKVTSNGKSRIILFSGDVGRWNKPIIRDPTLFNEADYVVVESTYGNRLHEDSLDIDEILCTNINSADKKGGNVVIPSFAIERSQELLYHLNQLLLEDRIPHLLVFIDSPMAINVTEVFEKHPDYFDREMTKLEKEGKNPFNFPTLKLTRTTEESKGINHIRSSCIIIAGSGMCTGGRIKHHLINNISRPESTVLFVGYQAKGTLGREIVEGKKEVRIHGKMYRIKAKIVQIHGLSAHADKNELLKWLSSLRFPPKHLFVVHGEEESALEFADTVREKMNWKVSVPEYQDEAILD